MSSTLLGELIAWWGFSPIYARLAAYIVTATMTWHLAGRAFNAVKRYRGKALAVPAGWKRLVPGVY